MENVSIEKPRYYIYSLAKGLRILQIFTEAGRPLTLSEIADLMNANSTTVTRLCYTLLQLGFLQRDSQRQYRMTPKILTLGYPVICRLEWQEIAEYFMEQLYEELQETVNLTVLDGPDILFILRIRKIKYLPYDIRIGTKLPVHCTASGKVLMAMGPPEKTGPVLKKLKFQPVTSYTITNRQRYIKELKEVRKKGYAVNDQEFSGLIRTVAAPIFDKAGYAIAAIGMTLSTVTFTREEMEKHLAPKVIETAHKVTDALSKLDTVKLNHERLQTPTGNVKNAAFRKRS
jgi:IclR family pca regulon transcriptional regulator